MALVYALTCLLALLEQAGAARIGHSSGTATQADLRTDRLHLNRTTDLSFLSLEELHTAEAQVTDGAGVGVTQTAAMVTALLQATPLVMPWDLATLQRALPRALTSSAFSPLSLRLVSTLAEQSGYSNLTQAPLDQPQLVYDAQASQVQQTTGAPNILQALGTIVQVLISMIAYLALVTVVAYFYHRFKELPPPVTEPVDQVAVQKDFSNFRDGVCDCFNDFDTCFCACCCPAVRWADTIDLTGLVTFWFAFAVYLSLSAFASVFAETIMWICLAIVLAGFRQEMRIKFGMKQTGATFAADCLCYCFCGCCMISQDARHVEAACKVGHPVVVEHLERRREEVSPPPVTLGPTGAAPPTNQAEQTGRV